MSQHTAKVTFGGVSLDGFDEGFRKVVQDFYRFVASSGNHVKGAS